MKVCLFGNKHLTRKFIELCILNRVCIDTLVSVSVSEVDSSQISGFDKGLTSYAESVGYRIFLTSKYSLNDPDSVKFFVTERFDLGVCLGWQRLIPDEIIETFSHGIYGWHGSLFKFPSGRGRSPINWSIRLGAEKIYFNFFRYDSKADTGSLYETIEVNIEPNEYVDDVQLKLTYVQLEGFKRLLSSIKNNSLALKEQPLGPSIFFPKLTEESGFIEVSKISKYDALNIVRSCSRPFPGAFVVSDSKECKLRLWRVRISDLPFDSIDKYSLRKIGKSFFIRFYDGLMEIDEYQEVYGDFSSALRLR
jgi:methionyl-tRNA formyltransferase